MACFKISDGFYEKRLSDGKLMHLYENRVGVSIFTEENDALGERVGVEISSEEFDSVLERILNKIKQKNV